MSNPNFDRIESDLAVIKQAAGLEAASAWPQIRFNLALAGIGLIVLLFTAMTHVAAAPSSSGGVVSLTYLVLVLSPVLVMFIAIALTSHAKRNSPVGAREGKRVVVAAVIAAPASAAFLFWSIDMGLPAGMLTIAIFFAFGLMGLIYALITPSARHHAGWAVSTLSVSVLLPLGSYKTAGIFAGGWLVVSSLVTAVLLAYSSSQRSATHDD